MQKTDKPSRHTDQLYFQPAQFSQKILKAVFQRFRYFFDRLSAILLFQKHNGKEAVILAVSDLAPMLDRTGNLLLRVAPIPALRFQPRERDDRTVFGRNRARESVSFSRQNQRTFFPSEKISNGLRNKRALPLARSDIFQPIFQLRLHPIAAKTIYVVYVIAVPR